MKPNQYIQKIKIKEIHHYYQGMTCPISSDMAKYILDNLSNLVHKNNIGYHWLTSDPKVGPHLAIDDQPVSNIHLRSQSIT